MAFCSKCGAPLAEDAKFCTVCGAPVEESPVTEAIVVEPVPDPQPLEKKLIAIFSYVDIFMIIYVIACRRDDEFLVHHANQALVAAIFALGFALIFFVGWILEIPLIVFIILNMVAAGNSRFKKLPILGGIRIIKKKEQDAE